MRSSTVRIELNGRQVWLPVTASIAMAGSTLQIKAETFFQGAEVPITATIDRATHSVDLQAEAHGMELVGLIGLVTSTPTLHGSGRVDLAMNLQQRADIQLHVPALVV